MVYCIYTHVYITDIHVFRVLEIGQPNVGGPRLSVAIDYLKFFILVKGRIHQESITIPNIYTLSIGAPSF